MITDNLNRRYSKPTNLMNIKPGTKNIKSEMGIGQAKNVAAPELIRASAVIFAHAQKHFAAGHSCSS